MDNKDSLKLKPKLHTQLGIVPLPTLLGFQYYYLGLLKEKSAFHSEF